MLFAVEVKTYSSKTRDIDTRQEGWDPGRGLIGLAEPFETRIGDGDTRFLRREHKRCANFSRMTA